MKKYFLYLVPMLLLCACTSRKHLVDVSGQKQKSIVILYENDVHCGIDGYAKLAGLRDAIQNSDTAFAAAVSSGDFLQGGVSGAISRGQYIVDIMRHVGYTAITMGNHEFDYGTPRMKELLPQIQTSIVCCNFFDAGALQPFYSPYVIRQFGTKRVAFVGVCTPESMIAEAYSFYDDEGNLLYDLKPAQLYSIVQAAVDDACAKGADYVVVLAHVGEQNSDMDIDSHQLVAATRGIDVVLDGHTHSVVPHNEVKNIDGKTVVISQTGTQLANVGKLLISPDGAFSTTLIPAADIPYESTAVKHATDSIKMLLEQVTLRKIGECDYALEIYDGQGVRQVRKAETNLSDLVTDAFRHYLDAEIGLCNGGGIRNTIPAGVITYGDAINVLPFDNHMCKIEATGSEIVAMLEKCIAALPEEDGSFPQVSGLRFTVHSVSHTVSDVLVLDAATGNYLPIDLARKYTICTTDYYNSSGFYGMLKECKLLKATTVLCRDALSDYIEKTLGGTLGSAYTSPQGRITMVND